jgi:hypothetical protein
MILLIASTVSLSRAAVPERHGIEGGPEGIAMGPGASRVGSAQ